MTDLLVLHPVGEPAGGAPWGRAFTDAGWDGPVHAPDLPGHAGTPPPPGGSYQVSDPALTGALAVAGLPAGAAPPVVVGVGPSGWAAQLLALGGRASALALVDGLGGPWLEPSAAVAADREWLRGIASDDAAVTPPPPGAGLDPRLHHGVAPQTDRQLALRAAAAVPVPVLVVTPRAARLSSAEVDDLVAAFPRGQLVLVDDASPARVAAAVTAWARRWRRAPSRPRSRPRAPPSSTSPPRPSCPPPEGPLPTRSDVLIRTVTSAHDSGPLSGRRLTQGEARSRRASANGVDGHAR